MRECTPLCTVAKTRFRKRTHILGLALAALLPCLAGAASDPLEGKWLGSIGTERERIEVGLEFLRQPDGSLAVRLTQPVSNYFGVDPGGTLQREGARIRHDTLALDLRLEGERLIGHFPGPRSRAELQRADALPQPQPPPSVPSGPGPRWQTRLGGQVYASPVVHGGMIYIGSTAGVFNAVDARDGAIRWTFSAGAPIHATAFVSDEAVLVSSDRGLLHRLDRGDGTPVWQYALEDGDGDGGRVLPHPNVFDWDWQGARPVLHEDTVYLGDRRGRLHAIDAASGALRWRSEPGAKIRTAAAVDAERVYVGDHAGGFRALDRRDGRPLWRHEGRVAVDTEPLLHAGRVYFGNRGGGLLSLDAATGAENWRLYFWGSWVESTPVLVDGTLYIGSSDLRRVSAIDPDSGTVRWRSDVHGWSFGTPLVLGERIYVGAAGGTPYFIEHQASFSTLDRRTGRLLTRWPLADGGGHQWGIAGSPAASDDAVIVALIEGSLLAFPRQDEGPSPAAPEPIAPGLSLLRGRFVAGEQPDGNSVLIDAPEGVIVFDSGRHPGHAERLLAAARSSGKPIAAILNSHWHLDHVSGNAPLREHFPEAEVHASTAMQGALTGFLATYRRQLEQALQGEAPPAQKSAWQAELARIDSGPRLLPTHPLRGDETRRIAGRELQLFLEPDAVSGEDLWAFDPESRTLLAGDLVTLPAPLFDTACPARWRRALERLRAIDFEHLVPGHGAPLTRSDLDRYATAFDALLACAASEQDAAHCRDAWLSEWHERLSPEDKALGAQLLDYYLGQVLRGEAAGRYCPAGA